MHRMSWIVNMLMKVKREIPQHIRIHDHNHLLIKKMQSHQLQGNPSGIEIVRLPSFLEIVWLDFNSRNCFSTATVRTY